ncbi:hypothetical protein TNCV_4320441 [Trichonephila clavipes]|nr:hypothetical protein TNCV_4320441 [Trichonephila clavipes]
MVYTYVVLNCNSNYKDTGTVQMFGFPKEDFLRKKWIQAISRKDFAPSKYSKLNINGTQRKIEELTEILNVNKIYIACLQETKLNPNLKLKIKGFTTLRKDRKDRAGGGLAFLVKSADIKFREIIMPPTTDYDEKSTEV